MHPSDLDLLMRQEQLRDLRREVENQRLVALARQSTVRAPASPRQRKNWRARWLSLLAWFRHPPRGVGHARV